MVIKMRCSCNHRDALLQWRIRSSYFVLRSPRLEGNKKNLSPAEIEGLGRRPPSGRLCRKSRKANYVRGVRDPQSSPRADCRRHGAYRPALPGFGAVEEPEEFTVTVTDYRLPTSRDPSPSREIEVVRSSYRTVPGKASFLQFSTVISLMVHFVRTRQDHAVMPRLVSQA
ncbi:hypothetical protein GEV33_000358 [Tenebrio molitor]|uniref:Uncharacterized protein n=1 Tax=Tenebrio molitor TaxID=7067 RepID=A0A8J6HYL6_TENMO|nr:hypothetical protein GEV33_000358 [Tenebrio molitor]